VPRLGPSKRTRSERPNVLQGSAPVRTLCATNGATVRDMPRFQIKSFLKRHAELRRRAAKRGKSLQILTRPSSRGGTSAHSKIS